MEKLNPPSETGTEDNSEKRDDLQESEKPNYLEIGAEVPNMKGYKISSMPFDNKLDAYRHIKDYWQNDSNVTAYFNNNDKKWYIISE